MTEPDESPWYGIAFLAIIILMAYLILTSSDPQGDPDYYGMEPLEAQSAAWEAQGDLER